jgi:hypothetical protein
MCSMSWSMSDSNTLLRLWLFTLASILIYSSLVHGLLGSISHDVFELDQQLQSETQTNFSDIHLPPLNSNRKRIAQSSRTSHNAHEAHILKVSDAQNLSSCERLVASLAGLTANQTIQTDATVYSCSGSLNFTSPNLTLTGPLAPHFATIHSVGARIHVAAAAIEISRLNLTGGWEIHLEPNASLLLLDLVAHSAAVSLGAGAHLSIHRAHFARPAADLAPAALSIAGGPATISVTSTTIEDPFPGELLAIAGDGNAVLLDSVLLQSARPQVLAL